MIDNLEGTQLIQELLTDPDRFREQGWGFQLWEAGLPVETLRPLLKHNDRRVRREAVWVASELGHKARSLIHDAIPLIYDGDRDIQYSALEIVMVCSFAENVDHFVHVVRSLQSDDKLIRGLAMFLVSNADASRLEAGIRLFSSPGSSDKLHKQGLSNLLKGKFILPKQVLMMIDDKEPLVQKYGTIAAKRLIKNFPELIVHAISSANPDVRHFSLKACHSIKNANHFVHVVRSLQNDDELMRIFSMHFMSSAYVSQLEAAARLLGSSSSSDKQHKQGLNHLIKDELLEPKQVLRMINDNSPLVRKYGAIAAKRLIEKSPELIANATSSVDRDVRKFSLKECSFSENDNLFVHVVRSLQSDDEGIRVLVMHLMYKAYLSQLEAAAQLLGSSRSDKLHLNGLHHLLKGSLLNPEQVLRMIDDKEPLVRRYGAIAAKRLIQKFPELIAHAAASTDIDVCKFSLKEYSFVENEET
ncbi:MAG: hypothetical protein VSS75_019395 [Candidatus Parabeggiatoa sp.]|nr:hypothetical protein [Candidatus Parabeggiatoa sp.]